MESNSSNVPDRTNNNHHKRGNSIFGSTNLTSIVVPFQNKLHDIEERFSRLKTRKHLFGSYKNIFQFRRSVSVDPKSKNVLKKSVVVNNYSNSCYTSPIPRKNMELNFINGPLKKTILESKENLDSYDDVKMTLSGETITSTDKLIKSLNVPSSEYVARYNNVMQQIGKIKTSEREFEDVTLNDLVHVSDIGAGMFGTVMKMQFVPTKEYFAVKHIILDEKNNDLRRIIMECYVLLDFSCHENIITCYGVLKKDTGLYLCMELMNSCLETLIKQHYKMGLEEKFVGKFTVNIVDGLDYLKENYIMHRDIKPSNLLLDQHGVIKICDFGISGILVNTVINTSNETGSVKYMAPERIDTKDPYDYRADIWSVGITVYEMINGFTPYDKEGSTFAVFATIKKGKEPRFVKDQVSPELEDFTHRCLTSLPANRPTYKILKEHLFIKESRKAQVRMEDLFNYMK